jgi:xanthine dehydrogenase accessory factor
VFRAEVLGELMEPDLIEGARTVVRRDPGRVREVEVDDEGILLDIDDPAAYRALFGSEPRGGDSAPGAGAIAELILAEVEAGNSVVVAAGLDGSGLRRAIVTGPSTEPRAVGSLGAEQVDSAVDALARAVLRGERPAGRAEVEGVPVYLEAHSPRPDMVVMGAGHIAQPLSSFGARLGFRVIVADDRAEFATPDRFPDADVTAVVDFADPFAGIPLTPLTHLVLVTRGHKYDFECLRAALASEVTPRYIGMIGSRRRVRATFQQLLSEGVAPEALARVRAPVGLDLGSETPAEIAVAVAAEMVMEWRGGSGAPLYRTERVLERFFTEGEG